MKMGGMKRALLFALLFLPAPAAAQLSPGELSQPHAGLEGSANCLKCHQKGRGVAPARCLDCHTEIKRRVAAGRGLHARAGFQACQTCHIEHHGRKFQLIDWGKNRQQAGFDHRQTGWPLEGAHARQTCRSCHQPKFVRKAPELAKKNPSRTFLGLDRSCVSCHRDEHQGQFAPASCLSCHTMASWRPPAKFDHARTAFPLSGQHQKVACASCHPSKTLPGGQDFLLFKGIRHQRCSDCHKDPHQGKFGATCQQCHSTAGWRTGALAGFDHARTGFPLTGQHRSLACASCHKPKAGSKEPVFSKMAHQRCTDCHKDPHQGRLGATCQQCHSTAGWTTGSRAKFDHGKTRFPLRGEHREVSCQQCHTSGRGLRFARFQACMDCHKDAHAGQLAARKTPGGAACESCHTVESFSPSTFTLQMHQQSGYPLEGAHLAVPCIACHSTVAAAELPPKFRAQARQEGNTKVIRFRWESTECRACHGDPHQGEVSRVAGPQGCRTCHSVEGWPHLAAFDHARTGFSLEGEHRQVPCGGCHARAGGGAPGTPGKRVRFTGTPKACNACHGDPHEGQFVQVQAQAQAAGAVGCQACHSAQGWTRITFDHDRRSRFKLEGAHRRLPCGACHRTESKGGKPVVRFKPLPIDCEGCHASRPPTSGGRS
jgi:hypothetical protein